MAGYPSGVRAWNMGLSVCLTLDRLTEAVTIQCSLLRTEHPGTSSAACLSAVGGSSGTPHPSSPDGGPGPPLTSCVAPGGQLLL